MCRSSSISVIISTPIAIPNTTKLIIKKEGVDMLQCEAASDIIRLLRCHVLACRRSAGAQRDGEARVQ